MRTLTHLMLCAVALMTLAGVAAAADVNLVHCFYFTPIKTATPEEWKEFYSATQTLATKIPGLVGAFAGKLNRPMPVFNPDAETRKKFTADVNKAEGTFSRTVREFGVCMAFKDAAALKAYSTNPAHAEWMKAYEKVRVAGTTTMDIVAPQ